MSVVSSPLPAYTTNERPPRRRRPIASQPAAPMNDKNLFLKRCDLFEHLTPPQKRRLECGAVMRTFRRHEIIYFPSEPGQSVLLLAKGRVKLKTIGPEGQETILAFIGAGELFGELAILDDEPRNEYAEAVEESLVLALPRDDLVWLMGQRPEFALHVSKLLGFRRRRIENRLRNI